MHLYGDLRIRLMVARFRPTDVLEQVSEGISP